MLQVETSNFTDSYSIIPKVRPPPPPHPLKPLPLIHAFVF